MKLTLNEILVLSEELNGTQNGKRKGILSHKLSIRVKYSLNNELNKKVIEYVKEFDEARVELIKELGTKIEGSEEYEIPAEKIEEFQKQLNELLSIEKNIIVPKINIGELNNIETEDYFPILLDKVLAPEVQKTETPVVEAEQA
jgi:hypothetical protein